MAKLVYLDETGSLGARIRDQPVLQLVATVVDEHHVSRLADNMMSQAMTHLGSRPADFEFHGNELWGGRGCWNGKTHSERLAAYEDAVALIPKFSISLAHSSIDQQKLHTKYDGQADKNAYRLALQFLLEKLDKLPDNKIIIADESKEEELPAVKMLADLQEWGGGEVPGDPLTTVIDSLHFVRSQASPGVQLADLCAFLLHRQRHTAEEYHPKAHAARSRMLQIIEANTVTYRMTWPA